MMMSPGRRRLSGYMRTMIEGLLGLEVHVLKCGKLIRVLCVGIRYTTHTKGNGDVNVAN